MTKMNLFVSTAVLAALAGVANADWAAGDVAILGANSDDGGSGDQEHFAFVVLRTINPGESLNFTDGSYGNNVAGEEDKIRWSEHHNEGGPLTWTATSTVTAGTVVCFDDSTDTFTTGAASGVPSNFSTSGDQIFAYAGDVVNLGGSSNYRGDTSGVTWVYGFDFAKATEWLLSGGGSTSNSYLPAALTEGDTANALALNFDNARYAGPRSFASDAAARAAIADPTNWITDDANPFALGSFKGDFTIPTPGAAALAGIAVLAAARRRR